MYKTKKFIVYLSPSVLAVTICDGFDCRHKHGEKRIHKIRLRKRHKINYQGFTKFIVRTPSR